MNDESVLLESVKVVATEFDVGRRRFQLSIQVDDHRFVFSDDTMPVYIDENKAFSDLTNQVTLFCVKEKLVDAVVRPVKWSLGARSGIKYYLQSIKEAV